MEQQSVQGQLSVASGVEQRADHHANEERTVNLFGDEGQGDGDHRRQEGKDRGVYTGTVFLRRLAGGEDGQDHQSRSGGQGQKIAN